MKQEHNPPEFHLEYRPRKLSDVIGQPEAVSSLTSMLAEDRLPHSILFSGPSGVGKSSLAYILANAVGCHKHDIHVVNGADERGIEAARDMIQMARTRPMFGDEQAVIVEECHQLSQKRGGDCQTTILDITEHPPAYTYFLFTTTHPDELLPTLRSRFCEVKLHPIAERLLSDHVHDIALEKGSRLTDAVCNAIAQAAAGSARVALKLLHQVIDLPEDDQLAICQQAMGTEESTVKELISAAVYERGVQWDKIRSILSKLPKDTDWEGLRRAILSCAHGILVSDKKTQHRKAYALIQAFRDSAIYIGAAAISAGFFEVFDRETK